MRKRGPSSDYTTQYISLSSSSRSILGLSFTKAQHKVFFICRVVSLNLTGAESYFKLDHFPGKTPGLILAYTVVPKKRGSIPATLIVCLPLYLYLERINIEVSTD